MILLGVFRGGGVKLAKDMKIWAFDKKYHTFFQYGFESDSYPLD